MFCSPEMTEGIHNHLIVLLALNGFVAITAFLGNTLILVALHKETSLHPPSKLLFHSLATTDLCVGLCVGFFTKKKQQQTNKRKCTTASYSYLNYLGLTLLHYS